jgi:predicted TIM-barrel fold metal-dependent hydrolase
MHIYNDRYPISGPTKLLVPGAGVEEYRLAQKRMGTLRTVVVQPGPYSVDNRGIIDGIAQLGLSETRGVAVVNPGVTDAELKKMREEGIRGIRFTLGDPATAVTSFEMIEPLAKRMNDVGWHVQFHLRGDQIAEHEDLLKRIVSPIVFDHMGRLPQPEGMNHPAFRVICNLIEKGKTWVKLSGAYLDSKMGAPAYADTSLVARAFIQLAPERVVWGSNWPHPTLYSTHKPPADDALLIDLLQVWAPDEALRKKILVDNPAVLYDFPKEV